MKKITQAATTGGAPIYLDDFKDVFNDEIWDAMQALLSPFDSDTEGIIISGCAVSGAGPHNIAAGIVYLDGEFRRFAAQTGVTLPQYIKAATDVNTSRTFEDTTTKTLYVTKSADLASSAPGAGQYIAITSATDPDNRRYGRPVFSDVATSVLKTKVVQIGDWDMNANPTKAVAHGVTDYKKIRAVSVIIRSDDDVNYRPLDRLDPSSFDKADGSVESIDSTNVNLERSDSPNPFDSTEYDATSYNRGWVTITYEA